MSLIQETRSPTELEGALHALGFSDAPRALSLLASCAKTGEERAALDEIGDPLLAEFGQGADPMRALLTFSRLCDRFGSTDKIAFFARLQSDQSALEELAHLLGFAPTLADSMPRAADVNRAFAAFQSLCETGDNRSLLHSLHESPRSGDALWTILGGSKTLSGALVRNPQLLDFLHDRALLEPARSRELLRATCRDYCFKFENRSAALRRFGERELLRIALRDLVLNAPSHEITLELALLAGACLDLAVDEVEERLRPDADSLALAIIGMGTFGGQEMGYASVLDTLFVFHSSSSAQSVLATRFAEELVAFLGDSGEEGATWKVDVRLRPQGERGPRVTTIAQLRAYFENPLQGVAVWERQALTKARVAAGDSDLGARAMTAIRAASHPPGWSFDWSDELLALKERSEREHALQNADTSDTFDVQWGLGTLSDIEWSAQWLSLKHGFNIPALQTPNTRAQLQAARDANLLAGVEFHALMGAYDWFRRAQLRLQIAQDNAPSSINRGSNDFQVWARAVLPTQPEEEAPVVFEETWRVHAQNVRMIFERVRDML